MPEKKDVKAAVVEKPSTSKIIFEKARAGYAALYLVSSEDMRSQREIKEAAKELKRKLFVWTLGRGLVEDGVKTPVAIPNTEDPPGVLDSIFKNNDRGRPNIEDGSIILLRLFHHFMDDPLIQAKLLDLVPLLKTTRRMLVVLTPVIKLPLELEKEFALIETQLPGKGQLQEVLDGIIEGSKLTGDLVPSGTQRDELIEAALGLTSNEAENAMTLSIIRPRISKDPNIWDPKIVMEEKCAALKKTGLLEYIPVNPDGLNQVGGLKNLKEWIRKRKNAFTQRARDFGLPPPKGMLCVGPAGAGKSLCAKAISGELVLPLLRLDMGKMFGSLVGQSEANIRMAVQVAEALSPCILWIDEVEKGMAGASAGSLDSGVGARVLGTILTWMQEKTTPVFVYATANDVTMLPPEFLRKGRFDEMFSVNLPNQKERKEILDIHIRKRHRGAIIDSGKLDIAHFANEATEGFSGAEIEAGIVEAMYAAFDAGKDLNAFDLQESFDSTLPLSKTMKEKLDKLAAWCKDRTRPANTIESTSPTQVIPGAGRNVEA
jgi:SpoVK/Ycf46/Vps4 family AAA+-type ATPase